jgi:hypothetical protein
MTHKWSDRIGGAESPPLFVAFATQQSVNAWLTSESQS